MKPKIGILLIALVWSLTPLAQNTPCLDIADEPNHQLLFQNDAVRIFQLDLAGSKATEEFCVAHPYLRVVATEGKTSDVASGISYEHIWEAGQSLLVYEPKRKAIRNSTGLSFREYDIEELQPVAYNPLTESTCGDELRWQCDPGKVSNHMVTDVHGPFTVRKVALGPGDQLVIDEAFHFVIALSAADLTYGTDKQLTLEPGAAHLLPDSEAVLKNAGNREARFISVDF